jgi:hypothetical protein
MPGPPPDKTITVGFFAGHSDRYTGQIRIREGCLVVYRDLPDGDFFTIIGIPLTSILCWAEVDPDNDPEDDSFAGAP